MVCPTCRRPGGPCEPHPEALQQFEVIIDEKCWNRMYVPCNVRAFLAEYIDERKEDARIMRKEQVEPALLTHEGRSYNALFKHRANYTKFWGGDWCIFADDYELRAGDRIEFELPDEGLNLAIQTYRGDKRLLPLPHVALDDLSSDDFNHVQCCVYSKDIELTYDQTRFFLQRLFRDTFICCRPFVHVLTPTNTKDCIMKIPRSVVSTLKRWVDVPTNGRVTLESPDEPTHVITPSSYYICKKDGRMVIEKSSFRDFISAASFVEENVVLITFKERHDRSVSIIIQRIP